MNAHDVPGVALVLRSVQHLTRSLARSLAFAGVFCMSLLTLLVPLYTAQPDQGGHLPGANQGALSTRDLCTVWSSSEVTARSVDLDPELADDESDSIWILSAEDSMDGISNVVNISAAHAQHFGDTTYGEAVLR